jgi:diphosphomevalonate decarboxylase
MAALAMNLMSLEKALNPTMTDEYFFIKGIFTCAIRIGSACRSVKGQVVVWEIKLTLKEAPICMALNFERNPRKFQNYQDTILLVDKGEKQVSVP